MIHPELRKTQQELRILQRENRTNEYEENRIDYSDNGIRRVACYTTQGGFLRGLVRMYSNTDRYQIWDIA
jgi:hypothetical protein